MPTSNPTPPATPPSVPTPVTISPIDAATNFGRYYTTARCIEGFIPCGTNGVGHTTFCSEPDVCVDPSARICESIEACPTITMRQPPWIDVGQAGPAEVFCDGDFTCRMGDLCSPDSAACYETNSNCTYFTYEPLCMNREF